MRPFSPLRCWGTGHWCPPPDPQRCWRRWCHDCRCLRGQSLTWPRWCRPGRSDKRSSRSGSREQKERLLVKDLDCVELNMYYRVYDRSFSIRKTPFRIKTLMWRFTSAFTKSSLFCIVWFVINFSLTSRLYWQLYHCGSFLWASGYVVSAAAR